MPSEQTQQPVAEVMTDRLTGCDKWRSIVTKYGWDTNVAMAIMQAESGCRSDAVGDTWAIGGITAPSCGLFQVRTLQGRPNCEQLKDPETNVAWAYKLHQARGWQPWSVYNNGAYKKFL